MTSTERRHYGLQIRNCYSLTLFLCLFLAILSSGEGKDRKVQEYKKCPYFSIQEVGFNYVRFKGDLHTIRALELHRNAQGFYLGKPILFLYASDIKKLRIFHDIPGTVPLARHHGFLDHKWYLVCGKSRQVGESVWGCEECVVLRYCDCWCDEESLFLRLTVGKVHVPREWINAGFLINLKMAEVGDYPFRMWVTPRIAWDPYTCSLAPYQFECDPISYVSFIEYPPVEYGQYRVSETNKLIVLNSTNAKRYHVDIDLVLDVGEIRKQFPQFNVQDEYRFSFGTFHFDIREFRNVTNMLLLPYGNQRAFHHSQALCQKVEDEVEGMVESAEVRSSSLTQGVTPHSTSALLPLTLLVCTLIQRTAH